MPALPPSLRRPHPWLVLFSCLWIGIAIDLSRAPGKQWSPAIYAKAVSIYQWTKPRLGFQGSCRFCPSCSRYSTEAARRHGLIEGWRMTLQRLDRCRTNVPMGTPDPVPEQGGQ